MGDNTKRHDSVETMLLHAKMFTQTENEAFIYSVTGIVYALEAAKFDKALAKRIIMAAWEVWSTGVFQEHIESMLASDPADRTREQVEAWQLAADKAAESRRKLRMYIGSLDEDNIINAELDDMVDELIKILKGK